MLVVVIGFCKTFVHDANIVRTHSSISMYVCIMCDSSVYINDFVHVTIWTTDIINFQYIYMVAVHKSVASYIISGDHLTSS